MLPCVDCARTDMGRGWAGWEWEEDSSGTVETERPLEVKERRGMSESESAEPLGEWSRMEFESVPERSGEAARRALLFAIILRRLCSLRPGRPPRLNLLPTMAPACEMSARMTS